MLLGILLVLCSCYLIWQRTAVKNCEFALDDIALTELGLKGASFKARILVKNPNRIDVVMDRLRYDFLINERKAFNGTAGHGLRIAAGKQATLVTEIDVRYTDLASAVWEALKLRRARYKISGEVYFDVLGRTFSFPVTIELPQRK